VLAELEKCSQASESAIQRASKPARGVGGSAAGQGDGKGPKKRKKPGKLLVVTRSAPSPLLFRARFCRNPADQV